MMRKYSLLLLFTLLTSVSQAQDPKHHFEYYLNGSKVETGGFAFQFGDKLEIKIVNTDENFQYKLDNVQLTIVPSQQLQNEKRHNRYWRKYCKSKHFSSKFSVEPRIELKYQKIYNRESTRLIVRVLSVSEKDSNGTIRMSSKFVLGSEYSFWNIGG